MFSLNEFKVNKYIDKYMIIIILDKVWGIFNMI